MTHYVVRPLTGLQRAALIAVADAGDRRHEATIAYLRRRLAAMGLPASRDMLYMRCRGLVARGLLDVTPRGFHAPLVYSLTGAGRQAVQQMLAEDLR